MRLDKYLADCGAGTRSEIKKMIRAGRVQVSAVDSPRPETQVDPATANVLLDGAAVRYQKYVYLMLNKPAGYVSATWDRNLPTVLDLLPEEYRHFQPFPVGRLDIDTEGLCLLTNDGQLAHRLLSPGRHIPKTYYVELDAPATARDARAFAAGLTLEDGYVTKPASLTILPDARAEVVIEEGKYHQIKRMFACVGRHVRYLKRIKMNRLPLDETLLPGAMRELTQQEMELLQIGVVTE